MKTNSVIKTTYIILLIILASTICFAFLFDLVHYWKKQGIIIYVSELKYSIDQPGNQNATINITLVFKKVSDEVLGIEHIQIKSLFTNEIGYQSVFQDFAEGDKLTISYRCEHLVSMAHVWKVIVCLDYMDFLEFEAIEGKEYHF